MDERMRSRGWSCTLSVMIPQSNHAQDVMKHLGSVATTGQLLEHLTRHELDTAVRNGHLSRLSRGRFTLRGADAGRQAAMRLSGSASHLSAALLHGWKVAAPPDKPWVTVPSNRNVPDDVRRTVHVTHGPVEGPLTSPLRTVTDCARRFSFREALSVADSALRSESITPDELRAATAGLRGPGSQQCRRVARHADGRAANPFESCLRAIALDEGLRVEPQAPIELPGRTVHPDVVDEEHRLVLEADSYLHHAKDITGFHRDLWRYTSLTVAGWRVLRFGYFHVMNEPDWVADCIRICVQTGE